MKLEGIRVLDLSAFLPGPHLTMTMADHGAEVIAVEPPGGEPARKLGYRQAGASVWFRNVFRGKKSIVLNLKTAAGREALLRLAEKSDVLVESFRPGVAERLGVDYPAVSARAPGIVYCSISAFGQSGPYRLKPAHDLAVEALVGVVSLNLGQDGEPAMPHLPVADVTASLMALNGILMALLRRQTSGRGDYLDVAMLDSTLAWLPNATGAVFAENRPPLPKYERSWGGASFNNLYRCQDGGWIALAGSERKFVENLLTALGRPDLIDLASSPPGPHHEPVKAFLRETFLGKTRDQWTAWFADKNVCFAPVLNLREAFDDPQVTARQMRVRDADGVEHIGIPLKFQHEPGRLNPRLPALGEHTEEVLRALAGYGDAELAALDLHHLIQPPL